MSKKLLFNFNREVVQNYTYVRYVGTIITATNTLEKPIKSATLKGSTKYRDIDTGEILEAFEEGRNLELVSVKMPVLTTSNEGGTKTNILTVNEPIELCGIGDAKDELDLITGEMRQKITKLILDGSEDWTAERHRFALCGIDGFFPNRWNLLMSDKYASYAHLNSETQYDSYIMGNGWLPGFQLRDVALFPNPQNQLSEFKEYLSQNPITVYYQTIESTVKTVDLSILDQNENKVSAISSFNDTTHITASSETIPPIFEGYLATKEVE